jgi:uncharacterized repeat protein (TIGR03806 family)
LVFHPDFSANRRAFIVYTIDDPADETKGWKRHIILRLSEFRVGAEGRFAPESESVLLDLPLREVVHHGGTLQFGPDGYLYMSVGDAHFDEELLPGVPIAQDRTSLQGSILRLDVDHGRPYSIPPTNPFAGGTGRGEIFAFGLRNPWGFSFDRETGDLWAGDSGQASVEEVDRIVSGGNYGWPYCEGDQPYYRSCDNDKLEAPVHTYTHVDGESIIGGYVYRGAALPLWGRYIYGDFVGTVWALDLSVQSGDEGRVRRLANLPHRVTNFAEDRDGELLIVTLGALYRLRPAAAPAEEFPRLLSATGCMDVEHPEQPLEGVIPYRINQPFGAEGAIRTRMLVIPDAAHIAIQRDGDLEFPVGTVLIQNFYDGDTIFETRLLARHDDGAWNGYSYAWRADGSDAELLTDSADVTLASGREWHFPSSGECARCHTPAARFALGLEVAQLDLEIEFPALATPRNQFEMFQSIGLISGRRPPRFAPIPALGDGDATIEERARSYLHVNCSPCHRPGVEILSRMDFRASTPLSKMGICQEVPRLGSLGLAGARLLLPGDAGRSVLPLRMRSEGAERMPPIGRSRVDAEGVAAVEAWIAELSDCS